MKGSSETQKGKEEAENNKKEKGNTAAKAFKLNAASEHSERSTKKRYVI